MRESRKTALVLVPKRPSKPHVELFERMGQALQFELVHPAPGGDRARSILQASFVLADVSGNDPEVLYDLGVAHTFGKRVFLITDTLDRLAYDLGSNRTWVIDPSSDNREIHQAMAQFLSVPNVMGPVRLFLGKFAFFGENLIAWRFLAFLIDAMWMLLLLGLALHLVIPGDQSTVTERIAALVQQSMEEPDGPVREAIDAVLVSAAYLALAYFALSTWLLRATLGQLVTGLRVVQTDYRRATFGQCVARSLLSMVAVMTYGAAFLSAIRGPGYQAVHDLLSGTIVVRSHAF
jgi:uncharacterized RDD family membrane protein YckC